MVEPAFILVGGIVAFLAVVIALTRPDIAVYGVMFGTASAYIVVEDGFIHLLGTIAVTVCLIGGIILLGTVISQVEQASST